MKKIIKISLILLSIMLIVTNVYAVSCNMTLQTAKNEYTKKDEFVVDVAISSLDTPEGIIALGATLEYDKSSLTLVEMIGEKGWSDPTYNEATGIFTMDRNALVNKPETVLKIKFKVNEQTDAKSAKITLKNITASGGISTGDIQVADMTKTISIKTTTTPPGDDDNNKDDNNGGNNNGDNNGGNNNDSNNNNGNNNGANNNGSNNGGNNNSNGNANSSQNPPSSSNPTGNPSIVASTTNNNENNSMKKGILPKAGATNIILIVLGGALILAAIFYIKMKIIDKKMGSK